jgi:hypothetical protein
MATPRAIIKTVLTGCVQATGEEQRPAEAGGREQLSLAAA